MENIQFENSFSYKLIYIFEIRDKVHKGLLKIGDATIKTDVSIDSLPPNCSVLNKAAKERIKQYTNTAGVQYNLLHTELAILTKTDKKGNGTLVAFRDHDVHQVLENSNIRKKALKGSSSREWFEVDLDTAKKAITAVKNNEENLGGNIKKSDFTHIVFRPEQEEAIKKTIKQFKSGNRMLWNAKMRFGKTLSALAVIQQCKFQKTIIITHRPVVDDGWYEDFNKIFRPESGYVYGSKNHGYTVEKLLDSGKNFVYFASIQDLRGSEEVGGKFDKNDTVFKVNWDLVIVDEAHEGTTTALGDEVIKQVVKEGNGCDTKFLALSGTPFNILSDYDDNIYTWDYIMEQQSKAEWDSTHFGDSNPYEELPEMWIYTYNLGKLLNDRYIELEDKAFNFHEFFRTWTGDIKYDFKPIPENAEIGDFVHEDDIKSFLNLITRSDDTSSYPFSTEEYRKLFKHTLWMVPGVREARALSKMMHEHPVFGSGAFNIVNVAGDGDQDEENKNALKHVKKAIRDAGEGGYTITLSCGKLTTGVTVKEWTAVLMLSGSFSTSAANYLQTIFRVQSPCNINGKIKTCCYVFDFAPDRTLKMVAESVAISTKAGKQNESDKRVLGEFLNYCPVISVDGTDMKKYNTNKLLQQLKRAYAERAVRNGFDDTNLYNDELLKLQDVDLDKFKKLQGIVGKSKASPKTNDIDINNQGFTDEEYDEVKKLKKKPKKERTSEEESRLKELQEQKKQRGNAISILRGISIRMPLLIYGADIDIDEDVTMDRLVELVDDSSWEEFMPVGVTKALFKEFIKYYDKDIFVAAGRKIRNIVKSADFLSPTERVKKIADLFACFKNPDKETVLTPWRVVNMHMSDCLGGYDFFDEQHEHMLGEPRFVDRGKVTEEIFQNDKAQVLEINSKTGLYPLFVTYSIYRNRRKKLVKTNNYELTVSDENRIWIEVVQNNMFVICKTPMAKQITKRTLLGYKDGIVNAHYFDDLINYMKNKPEKFLERIQKPTYWKKEGGTMKFDAVVGNPPYQQETGGGDRQAKPIYNFFVEQAKALEPKYVSMITPSRWFAGGMGLDEFRRNMLSDHKIIKMVDFTNAKDCFPQISIGGGVSYFLWSKEYVGDCEITNITNEVSSTLFRALDEFSVFVRYNGAVSILRKILYIRDGKFESLATIISPLMPYGLSTNYRGVSDKPDTNCLKLYSSKDITYIKRSEVTKGEETIDKYKVMISKMSAEHAGEPSRDGTFRVITNSIRVICPGEVCTHSYFIIGSFNERKLADNVLSYVKTRFVRFLILMSLSAVNLSKLVFSFVPLQDFTSSSDIDWSQSVEEIDQQLYAKYGLTKDETDYIESKIKPMD